MCQSSRSKKDHRQTRNPHLSPRKELRKKHSESRVPTAWKMMEYLTRPELMKWYVQNGNLSSPRFSTSADPEVRAMSNIIERVDAMEKKGQLQLWPRPPIPEFSDIQQAREPTHLTITMIEDAFKRDVLGKANRFLNMLNNHRGTEIRASAQDVVARMIKYTDL